MLRRWAVALAAALTWSSAVEAAPLELYGRLPHIEQVEVSPNGALVAMVVTNGESRNIAIQTTADRKPAAFAPAGATKVRDIRWAGDDHLIVTTSTTRDPVVIGRTDVQLVGPRQESFIAQVLNLKTGRVRGLLDNVAAGGDVRHPVQAMNVVLEYPVVRVVDGKPMAFVRGIAFTDLEGQVALFRIDLNSGVGFLAERGSRGAYDWLVDGEGRTLARTTYNEGSGAWSIAARSASGGWRTVEALQAQIERPQLVGLGRDGGSVLVRWTEGPGQASWRELSPESASWGETLAGSDGQEAILDPSTDRLLGTESLRGDQMVYDFVDPKDAAVWRAVTKAFPGDLVTLASWSKDRKKIAVKVDSPELGPAYALVALTTGQADWLGPEYAGLKAQDISPVKPVRYKARDGLEITGYLTLPRGRAARNLPLLVLAHGGPASRDVPGFDWWSQALASRGYAVLQANFRGSYGFGSDFYQAGFGEWGRKMQTDLSDGVRELARQGLIDPKRVCILGGSYGGYAALAGATLDRGVYRCAASYAGPSDLPSLINDNEPREVRYWRRFMGARSANDPALKAISPVNYASQVDIPVLLVHGRDDTVVTVWHSRNMAEALRRAGKPVELVELAGEDHWLSRGETRLQMLKATVDFLERHNPPN